MGCVVTGTKPLAPTTPRAPSTVGANGRSRPRQRSGLDWVLALPRFLLGSLGGLYYALVPVYMYMLNVVVGPATPYLLAVLVAAVAAWLLV